MRLEVERVGVRQERKTQTADGVVEPTQEGPLQESGTQEFQAAWSRDFLQ